MSFIHNLSRCCLLVFFTIRLLFTVVLWLSDSPSSRNFLVIMMLFYLFEMVAILKNWHYQLRFFTLIELVTSVIQCTELDMLAFARIFVDFTLMMHCKVLSASRQLGFNDSHYEWIPEKRQFAEGTALRGSIDSIPNSNFDCLKSPVVPKILNLNEQNSVEKTISCLDQPFGDSIGTNSGDEKPRDDFSN